jgi:hypothetical protein
VHVTTLGPTEMYIGSLRLHATPLLRWSETVSSEQPAHDVAHVQYIDKTHSRPCRKRRRIAKG